MYRRGEENEEINFSTNFFSSSSSLLRAILPLSRKFSNFDRTIIDLYYTRFLIPKIHPVVKRCPLSRHLFVFSIKYNLSQCNEPEKKKRKRGRGKKKKKLSNDQSRSLLNVAPGNFDPRPMLYRIGPQKSIVGQMPLPGRRSSFRAQTGEVQRQ